jgi:hypothetical protein
MATTHAGSSSGITAAQDVAVQIPSDGDAGVVASVNTALASMANLLQWVKERVRPKFTTVTLNAGWAHVAVAPVKAVKAAGMIVISGGVRRTGGGTSPFTLPVGLRPSWGEPGLFYLPIMKDTSGTHTALSLAHANVWNAESVSNPGLFEIPLSAVGDYYYFNYTFPASD